MFPKAHLTSHSRMSGSRWVIIPSWLSQSLRSVLYSSSLYSFHLFLISSASLRSILTDYILCSQRWRTSIHSAKTRAGADCGSDHELLIVKFRLKLKKVGKTTRPFRYDLYQITYDYTVEVRNRFKGLDLIECLMNYGWRFVTLYRRQGSWPPPWKRSAKKQNGCLGRPYK